MNCRSSSFVCRNINAWNSLPEHVVNCETAATFKRKLSTVDLTQFVNFLIFIFFKGSSKSPLRPHSPLAVHLYTYFIYVFTWFADK